MQYQISNKFAPHITEVELSEKELRYIQELANGEEKANVIKALEMTMAEVENLYSKLGLTNQKRDRDVQAVVIAAENKLI